MSVDLLYVDVSVVVVVAVTGVAGEVGIEAGLLQEATTWRKIYYGNGLRLRGLIFESFGEDVLSWSWRAMRASF